MLSQDNSYAFNKVLTYLDQGGNNIWWNAYKSSNTTSKVSLVQTKLGLSTDCIEDSCIPICDQIIENDDKKYEYVNTPQKLIYPTFNRSNNVLTITLNNLRLNPQPSVITDDCINNECMDKYGAWTTAISSNVYYLIDDIPYYFIQANADDYGYSYLYQVSAIHIETGEEIFISKEQGLIDNTVTVDLDLPESFSAVITITKFNLVEIVSTYRFVERPLYLRSNWETNIPWTVRLYDTENILWSIIYLLLTDVDISLPQQLVLYKDRNRLADILLLTINDIAAYNTIRHSYVKTATAPIEYTQLVDDKSNWISNLVTSPNVLGTTNYTTEELPDITIQLLSFLALILAKQEVNAVIDTINAITTRSLKNSFIKLIAYTELYVNTNDVTYLSLATTLIKYIKYCFYHDGVFLESLNNPVVTTESTVYGDLFTKYVYNIDVDTKKYLGQLFNYLSFTTPYYINADTELSTQELLLFRLINVVLPSYLRTNSLIVDVQSIPISSSRLTHTFYECLEMYEQQVFTTFKATIPVNYTWLSEETPIQDLVIRGFTKPLIDLYVHARRQKDIISTKTTHTQLFNSNYLLNRKELLTTALSVDSQEIRSTYWSGAYSNTVDIEILGYIDDYIKQQLKTIEVVGIPVNVVSGIEMPLYNDFDICFDIVKLEDYRCQVEVNGQLILRTDGQCALAPVVKKELLQEIGDPITQETDLLDSLLIE